MGPWGKGGTYSKPVIALPLNVSNTLKLYLQLPPTLLNTEDTNFSPIIINMFVALEVNGVRDKIHIIQMISPS